jgi:multiple sugar transport system ATP-binding protein
MTLGQRVAVLNLGVAQQVDTPQRLYRRPANTFVASFIGSPPMNFAEGEILDGAVRLGELSFELPQTVRARLRRGPGKVLLGLRPEEFQDARLVADTRPTVTADIEVTELLGPETFAYFRVPGLRAAEVGERPIELAGAFAARLDLRSDAAPGRRLELAVDLENVHLFDPESGQSILDP